MKGNSLDPEYSGHQISLMGDSAIHITLSSKISPEINEKIMDLRFKVERLNLGGIRELVPSYNTLVIHFDPFLIKYEDLMSQVALFIEDSPSNFSESSNLVLIPTCYGGELGPDLETVSDMTGLSQNDVIDIHCGTDYRVYALGFSPGFPYLGGLDVRLFCARLDSPRVKVPAGSVAIAETQTGVYPVSSPGGWRLIGKTPLTLFDPFRSPPSFISPGDYVRFSPVEDKKFGEIQTQVLSGKYDAEVRKY